MGLDFDPVVLGKNDFRNPSSHGLQKAGQIFSDQTTNFTLKCGLARETHSQKGL